MTQRDEREKLREAHAEIQRLQDAKRRALAIADERAKENVALREALIAIIDASQSFRNSMPKDWEGDPLQDAINAASVLSNAPPTSEGGRQALDKANYKMGWWLSGALDDPQVCAEMKADINAWFEAHQPGVKITPTAPEPADTVEGQYIANAKAQDAEISASEVEFMKELKRRSSSADTSDEGPDPLGYAKGEQ